MCVHTMLCYAMLCYAMLCYAMLCYAMLCYSILGCVLPLQESSPLPEPSIFLRPLLSLSIPLPVAPQCHLSNDILVFRLILHPLSDTSFSASNSPSIIFHSGDVSSLFPFRTGYVLNYVCHSGTLPNDGVLDSVF